MSASVGAAGTAEGASGSFPPRNQSKIPPSADSFTTGRAVAQIQFLGAASVLGANTVEVAAGLLDLGLGTNGLQAVREYQRLDLEGIDGVHGRVDVLEGSLQLLDPDGSDAACSWIAAELSLSISLVRWIMPLVVALSAGIY